MDFFEYKSLDMDEYIKQDLVKMEFIFNYLLLLNNFRNIFQFLCNDKLYKILNDLIILSYEKSNLYNNPPPF